MEINTEAGDANVITACPDDDAPSTGMFLNSIYAFICVPGSSVGGLV